MKKLLILGALAAGMVFFAAPSTAQADHRGWGGYRYYSPRVYSGYGYGSPYGYGYGSPYGYYGGYYSRPGFSISIGSGGFWGGFRRHRHHHHYHHGHHHHRRHRGHRHHHH